MNLIKYMVNRRWRTEVNRQMELDQRIAGQKSIAQEQVPVAFFAVYSAVICIAPGELVFAPGEDKSMLLFYMMFIWVSLYLYDNRFLKVIENEKKVSVFKKYAYVPVDWTMLIYAKIIRLAKRCLLYILVFQGINFLAKVIWANVANDTITWSALNLWPAAVIVLAYFIEYVRIRICAAKI